MKKELLKHIICPHCISSLEIQSGYKMNGSEINSGFLYCKSCESTFPIQNDIPRFVPHDNYSDSFGFQWNLFKKIQLDNYSKTTISKQRFFNQSNWDPKKMKGALVLDAGCGSGRFAEIAIETGATVIAVDYSSAIDACWDNLKHKGNLHAIQADINALPLEPGSFDYIYSFGVLQHTPDPKKAFFSLRNKVTSRGQMCIDCYQKDWRIYLWIKYWLRPITKNMPAQLLLKIIRKIVPLFLPISNLLIKIPRIGHYLRYALPVANYKNILPLNDTQLLEWSILDTFDMYAPKFDNPQTLKEIKQWFKDAKLTDSEIFDKGLIIGRGRG